MRPSITELCEFYATASGAAVRAMVLRRLHALWPPDSGAHTILGLGYSAPYLESYRGRAHKILQAQPAAMGIAPVMSKRGNMAALVHDDALPFAPASFDRVLAIHALEDSDNIAALLHELWRVLMPEGRAVLIVPNRSGLWASSDASPFGDGRPFTRAQLAKLARAAQFRPIAWSGAVYVPPRTGLMGRRMVTGWEKFGETVWPRFSGLTLVELRKRLYAESDNGAAEKRRMPNLAGANVGTAGAAFETGRTKRVDTERR